jgi:hypothetical protein
MNPFLREQLALYQETQDEVEGGSTWVAASRSPCCLAATCGRFCGRLR